MVLDKILKFPFFLCKNHVWLFRTGKSIVRAMIVTSWRSGSTLVGELLNSVPGSYYSYEPLSFAGINRIYNNSQKDLIQSSLNVIEGIFKCNYSMVERECKLLE